MESNMMIEEREGEDGRDILSELHESVLFSIIHFLNTKTTVQTSVLSKQWKNLWKCVSTLRFKRHEFKTTVNYNKFVFHVFSNRDKSIPLHYLDLDVCGVAAQRLLKNVSQHMHHLLHLEINIDEHHTYRCYHSIPSIFSSPSLTSLTLSIHCDCIVELPPSLHLPALKTLNLTNVSFTASFDLGYVEPFSNCVSLNTLVLVGCSLEEDMEVLSISNSNLSRFTVERYDEEKYQIELSTPNLTYFSIKSCIGCHYLSSTCDLSLLEEVSIDITTGVVYAVILRWLKIFSYVKILRLSTCIRRTLLRGLSGHAKYHITLPPRVISRH